MDFGLISLKDRDSYAKLTGRSGMRGFWPLDLDLRARNRSARDLIVAVQIESGGSDLLARGRRRESPEATLPRRRMAGDGRPGALGSQTGCGLVLRNEHDSRNSLGPGAGHGEALRVGGDCGGGSAR